MALKNCVVCGTEFDATKSAIACSPDCSHVRRNEKQRDRRNERMKDPEYRERIREQQQRLLAAHPEYLERGRERARERWTNEPEYREQRREQQRDRTERYNKRWANNHEHHERVSKIKRGQARERYANDPVYRERELEKVRQRNHARRAAKAGLAYPVTVEQINFALSYFHGCCAVCECQLNGMFGETKKHDDHWIPLSYKGDDNPGSVASNIVPLCRTCNLTKHATMPEEWLNQKYSKRKAAQIIERIETYFEEVRGLNTCLIL